MDTLRERLEQITDEIRELTRDLGKASGEELNTTIERLHQLHRERQELESLGIQTTHLRR